MQLGENLTSIPGMVANWRKRATAEDMKTGPSEPRSMIPAEAEEAMVAAFRHHTLLPLDDCLYALQPWIPADPIRSAPVPATTWHLASDRRGGRQKPRRQKFKRYPIGFFHIDTAEVQTREVRSFSSCT